MSYRQYCNAFCFLLTGRSSSGWLLIWVSRSTFTMGRLLPALPNWIFAYDLRLTSQIGTTQWWIIARRWMHLVHNLTSKEWFCLCGEPQYSSFTTVSIVTLPCNEHIRYWYKHQPRVSHMLIWIKSSVLAVICSLATFQPRFRDPYLRPVRAATFRQPGYLHHGPRSTWATQVRLGHSKATDGCCMGSSNTCIERLGCHGLCLQSLLIWSSCKYEGLQVGWLWPRCPRDGVEEDLIYLARATRWKIWW